MRQLLVHGIGYGVVLALGVGGTATALAGHDTVFSDDIKDGQVRMKDLAPRTAAQLEMPDLVPSGVTVRGAWGYDAEGAGRSQPYREFVSFPVAFAEVPEPTYVTGGSAPGCPGMGGSGPEADPGYLCIYEVQHSGTSAIFAGPMGNVGFQVRIQDDAYAGPLYADGVWAATAP